jgi:hypothetical protein
MVHQTEMNVLNTCYIFKELGSCVCNGITGVKIWNTDYDYEKFVGTFLAMAVTEFWQVKKGFLYKSFKKCYLLKTFKNNNNKILKAPIYGMYLSTNLYFVEYLRDIFQV